MGLPAEKIEVSIPQVRRFEYPDITRHAEWLLPRLRQKYPALTPSTIVGWLQGPLYQPEFSFLFLPDAVGLAQTLKEDSLDPQPVVVERFVWVRDKTDPEQIERAAEFYAEFARWGKHKGCEMMLVERDTDVPHEKIKEKLGRVYTRQQQFARLRDRTDT